MERRQFFKNIAFFGCGCAAGAAGALETEKIRKQKEELESSVVAQDEIQKVLAKKRYWGWIKHVEFIITQHCNLNCAFCNNMSPIAPKKFLDLDIFEKDIKQLSKITKGKIREVALMGGEPLLNKNIEKYIKIARKNFPDSNIVIKTNGLLLNEMPDSFYQACALNKAEIQYTQYPLYKDYPVLLTAHKKAKEYNIYIEQKASIYYFNQFNLDKKSNNNKKETHEHCEDRFCLTLNEGTLYPCPCAQSVDMFFNKHFTNNQIPFDKEDTLDIYKISDIKDIYKFIKTPKQMCRYCNFTNRKSTEKIWRLSKGEISEWMKT